MKKLISMLALIIVFIGIIISLKLLYKPNDIKHSNLVEDNITKIRSHYNKIVIVNKDTILYDEEKLNIGNIKANTIINLSDDINITENTKYFVIDGMNYYIKYEDVSKYNAELNINRRYEKYVPFDENIITKNITNFYNENFDLEFTINKSFEFPIIIKENKYYGIQYNNKLYYINNEDIESKSNIINSDIEKASKILTLAYHYIYDPKTRKCTQVICNSKKQVEMHFKYLMDNNYLSITLKELEMFFDNKIELPKKVIAVTIDDGYIDNITYELLEKYKIYATLFIITGRFNDLSTFNSPYLSLESHTNNMHNSGECKGYGLQGGGILCKSDEYILNDLKTSQDKIGKSNYFAYPFYDWNDRAIKLLKKAGFTMAFVGQRSTNGYANRNVDKFKVPRKTILSTTTEKNFLDLFN